MLGIIVVLSNLENSDKKLWYISSCFVFDEYFCKFVSIEALLRTFYVIAAAVAALTLFSAS